MFAYSKWLKNKNAYQSIALLEAVLRKKRKRERKWWSITYIPYRFSKRERERKESFTHRMSPSHIDHITWCYYSEDNIFTDFLSSSFFVFSNRKIDKTKHIIRYWFEVINIVGVFKLQMCFFFFLIKIELQRK